MQTASDDCPRNAGRNKAAGGVLAVQAVTDRACPADPMQDIRIGSLYLQSEGTICPAVYI